MTKPTVVASPCAHCGEPAPPWRCDPCRREIVARCPECHAEVVHGVIGPPPKQAMARHPQRPAKFHEDEDMNRRADD